MSPSLARGPKSDFQNPVFLNWAVSFPAFCKVCAKVRALGRAKKDSDLRRKEGRQGLAVDCQCAARSQDPTKTSNECQHAESHHKQMRHKHSAAQVYSGNAPRWFSICLQTQNGGIYAGGGREARHTHKWTQESLWPKVQNVFKIKIQNTPGEGRLYCGGGPP